MELGNNNCHACRYLSRLLVSAIVCRYSSRDSLRNIALLGESGVCSSVHARGSSEPASLQERMRASPASVLPAVPACELSRCLAPHGCVGQLAGSLSDVHALQPWNHCGTTGCLLALP